MSITIFQPSDCDAEYIGETDEHGNALEVEWIGTADQQARRDDYLRAGARVDSGPALAGKFRRCKISGPIPTGDRFHVWTIGDFYRQVP